MAEKHGYTDNKEAVTSRLKRIEGQVRGVQKMVAEDRYCVDILVQLAAIKSAVHQTALNLLDSHTHHCVRGAIESGSDDANAKIEELMDVIRQFSKS